MSMKNEMGGQKMKSDMLVKLYNIPEETGCERLGEKGILIKRALAPDCEAVLRFVTETFGNGWRGECAAAFSRTPTSCYIAVSQKQVVGFACFDSTAPDFFGPTGISPDFRGEGIGRALLLKCLHSMKEEGYAYAVIGDTDEASPFYEKTVGAISIPDSFPGIYRNMITE